MDKRLRGIIGGALLIGLMVTGCGDSGQTTTPGDVSDTPSDVNTETVTPPDTEVFVDSARPPLESTVRMIFSANFSSEGGCRKQDSMGCDLFMITLDFEEYVVTQSSVLTNAAGEAERFPSLDRSERLVAFEKVTGNKSEIAVYDLSNALILVITDGRYPDFAHHDSLLSFSTKDKNIFQAKYTAEGNFSAEEPTLLTPGRDPQFAPNGKELIYHYQPEGGVTRTAILDLNSLTATDFSEADSSAHASFSFDSSIGAMGKEANAWHRKRADGVWGPVQPLASPKPPSEYLNDRFNDCDFVSYGFPEFCGDNNHLVVNAGCHKAGDLVFSNLMMIDLSDQSIIDLHAKLSGVLGPNGAKDYDTYTLTCGAR
jgi:hypothetical protein